MPPLVATRKATPRSSHAEWAPAPDRDDPVEICGLTLAQAHARSGDRIASAAYLGKGNSFDRALAEFAESYADQNERDYEALRDVVREGRVEARAATG